MDITPYADRLRADLSAAAEGAGPDIAQAAIKLGYAIDPAVRLALMEALSHAAAEITAELEDTTVDVRLDGRDLAFVVQAPELSELYAPPPPPQASDEDEKTARITLRLPESTKSQAEEAASLLGQSLNTWLIQVVHAAANRDVGGGSTAGRSNRGRQMRGWV